MAGSVEKLFTSLNSQLNGDHLKFDFDAFQLIVSHGPVIENVRHAPLFEQRLRLVLST